MKTIRVTYFALATLISAASCTKEAAEPAVVDWSGEKIYFKTSLSDVTSSRADDMTLEHLESFQVTCFNTGDKKKDAAGFISPYFADATFIRQITGVGPTYVSAPGDGPYNWPATDGLLKFFAFAPSRDIMAAGNPDITDANSSEYFNLTNSSTEINSTVAVNYSLDGIRVNRDIARQFDFVTAATAGERWKDFGGGVELAFCHQLSQVEIHAWGTGSEYDFEIAGVRIGNPVIEGTFVFSDESAAASYGGWSIPEDAVKGKVEYLYSCSGNAGETGSPEIGDRIFHINNTEHNSSESAASIMGRGGCAMVLPTVNPKWEGLADPEIGAVPYSTGRMYFSILMRVTASSSGTQLYPYSKKPEGMTVIYYAVDDNDAITARVYPGDEKGEFYTDSELTQPYMAAKGEQIKEFGWAAVPVDANWKPGKRYVYTLNYSEGIGIHDPEDPEPGKPIKGLQSISWGVSVGSWSYASKNPDYDPDVEVP